MSGTFALPNASINSTSVSTIAPAAASAPIQTASPTISPTPPNPDASSPHTPSNPTSGLPLPVSVSTPDSPHHSSTFTYVPALTQLSDPSNRAVLDRESTAKSLLLRLICNDNQSDELWGNFNGFCGTPVAPRPPHPSGKDGDILDAGIKEIDLSKIDIKSSKLAISRSDALMAVQYYMCFAGGGMIDGPLADICLNFTSVE